MIEKLGHRSERAQVLLNVVHNKYLTKKEVGLKKKLGKIHEGINNFKTQFPNLHLVQPMHKPLTTEFNNEWV